MIDQDIARRMDAYRGNPQALMQRYAQSQELIDLLALQKLKSEKEAAARSLQMAGAPQGQPPTIAQQREQEVMGMTQREVAQQVGAAAQQRAAKEREAMQRLMSGIASAPGAENMMPEQAMAAGGIVAFQAGGFTDEMAEEARQLDEQIRQAKVVRRQAEEQLRTYSTARQRVDPQGYAAVEQAAKQAIAAQNALEQQYSNLTRVQGPQAVRATTAIPRSAMGQGATLPVPTTPPVEPPLPDSRATAIEEVLGRAGPQTPVAPPAAPQTPPPAAPQAAAPEPLMMGPPRPEAPPAGLPAALPQGQDDLRSALMAMMNPNIAEMTAQRRGMIPGMDPERLAARQRAIEESRGRFAKEFDPKQQAMQQLIAFLINAGGRTSVAGALGAGAAGSMNLAAQQRAQEAARRKEIEGQEEGLRAMLEGRELEQAKAGMGALEAAQRGQQIATSGLASLTGSELQAQTSRENAQLQAMATRENAQATRELRAAESEARRLAAQESLAARDLTKYLELSRQRETLAREYFKTLKEDPKNMKVPDATLRTAVDQLLSTFDRDLQVLGQKVGMPSTPRGMNLPSSSAIEAELRRREGK